MMSTNRTSQSFSQKHMMPNIEEFRNVLREVGISLTSNIDEPNILNQEQALVVRELTRVFNDGDNELSSKFMSCLKYLCKKEKHFRKFLIPSKFQKVSCENNLSIYQDGLISIFLRVPALQDNIIEILLETVTEVVVDETQDTSWLRMLLKPLRCLPTIRNGESLAKKILDILEISTFPCQLELLEAIPEILPDNQCDFAARQLTKLLDENEQLCGAIVDCLTALNLDSEIRNQIHDRILVRILAGVSLKVYLILIKFLISDYKSQTLVSILLKIRNSLDNIVGGSSQEKESDKTLIFQYLQTSAVTQKPVAEGWLNTISNIKNYTDHKPIDLLIMFMLHHTSEIRKKVIEGTFRKRVSMGLFKVNLLNKTLNKYMTQQLLKDYMGDIIDIGCCLLRCAKDNLVAKYATTLFELLFNHDHTGAIYRGEILSNLISLTGSNDNYTTGTVLKIIQSLIVHDHKKVQTHVPLLMQLLEILDTFEFKDVKVVYDILCALLCGRRAEDSLSGFKDQIYNTIRKQLSCCERITKHRGIISAIVMIKHTASVSDVEVNSSLSERSITVATLPSGPPKEAAELLELITCAAADNPELLCLYYDQLASILASEEAFDKYFLYWLYKKFEDDFETIFLTSAVPENTNDLSFSVQYVLNQPKESDSVFAINIAGYAICAKNDKIILLAPYFRVLRLLHFRQHESLSEIDSLLGCGVVLPKVNDPDDLVPNQIKDVVDCLFHCANWFREIISAFVSQKGEIIRRRVVTRLNNLLEVEAKLFEFLKQVPDHNLPLCYFDSIQNLTRQPMAKTDSKLAKNPRKKMKVAASTSLINDTTNVTLNSQDVTKSVASSSRRNPAHSHKVQFREMDTDLIRLMKYPLNLERNRDEHDDITLNMNQINFILTDFTSKLLMLTQNKNMGLSHLNDVSAEHLIRDCVKIVPNINRFLETIVKEIEHILEEPEETYYTNEVNDVKTCFGSILQIYYLIFQWPNFQQTTNGDLLRDLLKSTRHEGSPSLESTNRLCLEFAIKVSNYGTCCLHLSHAVSTIKIMETLYGLTIPTKEFQKKISSTAETFLSKRWYDFSGKLDQGQASNQSIDILVRAYLKTVNVESIADLIKTLIDDISSLEPKDGCLKRLGAIDNKNFHVLYLGLCNALISAIKTEIQSLTNREHLTLWFNVAVTMTNLMTIAKTLQHRNLPCFLKKTIAILKIFLTHGIPIMEIMLKNQATEVTNILRTIQSTTRFLHHLCCQSKMTQDASVVAYIPMFKHTIESIIYRVKAALVVNNCSTAFWFGNLRNRDLHGEDIVSQSTVVSSIENASPEEEEKLPSDDDEDILNSRYSDNDDSVESEVYG